MKNLIAFISLVVLCGLGSDLALAKNKSKKEHPKSDVEVSALNSPVAGNEAIFEFKISKEHSVAKATYQIFAKKEMKPKAVTLEKKSNDQYEAKIDVSSLANGDYKIKFNLFSKKGKKEHHLFGRDKKHWVNFSVKRSVVVVNPGEETLLGIDADNDGVRDDVQAFITERYKSSPNMRNLMLQKAKLFQMGILHSEDKTESNKVTHKMFETTMCKNGISAVGVPLSKAYQEEFHDILIPIVFNTKARILAYRKMSEHFSGQMVEYRDGPEAIKYCEFEIE